MQTTQSGWHGAKKCASEDCARPITDGIITDLDFDTVVGYHWIRQINSDKFCYLGDITECRRRMLFSRYGQSDLYRNSFVNTYPY